MSRNFGGLSRCSFDDALDLAVFFSLTDFKPRGLDPKYIDPVPVTQKVIEGGGMGFFRRKNGEVGVLVRFDDAHWREKIAMIFCFGIANGRV